MQTRSLSPSGPRVSALGLGCMGMSEFYGYADHAESVATVHAALDAGITLLDTGDFYGMGANELLLREALAGRRDGALISVKFGALRDPGGGWSGFDSRPASVRNFLAMTLKRLGTDYIDIYRPSRLDPTVPIEDTVGAIADMVKAGYVRHIGLSEVGADTIRRAVAVHPIVDLQIEYSLISRGIEAEILPTCRALGVGITAYGVLSRGLLSGNWSPATAPKGDGRAFAFPRFKGENLKKNQGIAATLAEIAAGHGATATQVAFAWALSRGEHIVPLVGARRRDRLREALGALELQLSAADLAEIEAAIPADAAAGERYDARGMSILDSERRT